MSYKYAHMYVGTNLGERNRLGRSVEKGLVVGAFAGLIPAQLVYKSATHDAKSAKSQIRTYKGENVLLAKLDKQTGTYQIKDPQAAHQYIAQVIAINDKAIDKLEPQTHPKALYADVMPLGILMAAALVTSLGARALTARQIMAESSVPQNLSAQ